MLIEPHQGIIVTGAANGIGRATVMTAVFGVNDERSFMPMFFVSAEKFRKVQAHPRS